MITSRQGTRPAAAGLIDFLDRINTLVGKQLEDTTPGDRVSFRALRDHTLKAAKAVPPMDMGQIAEARATADELVDIAMEVWGRAWGTGSFVGLLAAVGVALQFGLDCHAIRDVRLRSEWRALIRAHGRFLVRLATWAKTEDLEHGRQTGEGVAAMLFQGEFLMIEDEPAGIRRAA